MTIDKTCRKLSLNTSHPYDWYWTMDDKFGMIKFASIQRFAYAQYKLI